MGIGRAPAGSSSGSCHWQLLLVKTLLRRVRDAYEVDVAQAQRTYHAEVECWIVDELAPDLDRFIRLGSSDPSNFPVNIFDELAVWRKHLVNCATPGLQSIVMDRVYERSSYFFSPQERADLLDKYKSPIKAAAEDAIRVYDKYIPELRTFVRHRLRFEPSRQPDDFPMPEGDEQINATQVANFFGVAEGKVSVALVTLPCAKFWAHNDVKAWFDGPQLSTLGAWYAEIPITNVPSERVFAIMRSCEGHLRHNLTEDSMTEEVSAKCNDWVLEGMLQRQTQLFARK